MRHALGLVLAAGMAMLPLAARAETPDQLLRHIFADPGFMFHPRHRAPSHKALPPNTPLVDVPMPHLRPAETPPRLAYQAEEPRIDAAPLAPPPLPHLSPPSAETQVASLPPSARVPSDKPKTAPAPDIAALPPLPGPAIPPQPGGSICMAELTELGVVAKPLPPIVDGACGMPDPVKVTALAGGRVKIDGDATVDCAVATTLARFVNDHVAPQAEVTLGGKLTALRVLDSYSCRNRDGLVTAKLSEHAHGNAIDIGGFQIDGKRWITVGDSNNGVPENTFLVAVRQSACGPFTTVLGPGADTYHASHFHLDLIQRRTAGPSHGLYCE